MKRTPENTHKLANFLVDYLNGLNDRELIEAYYFNRDEFIKEIARTVSKDLEWLDWAYEIVKATSGISREEFEEMVEASSDKPLLLV